MRAFVLALNGLLPVLRVVKRARLAVQDQPSPSKPVIPRTDVKVPQYKSHYNRRDNGRLLEMRKGLLRVIVRPNLRE